MSNNPNERPAFPEKPAKKLGVKKAIWLIALFGFMAVALIGGLAGGIMGYLDAQAGRTGAHGWSVWFLIIGGVLAGLIGLWWSLKYWKAIDEMARRAHLEAFFWGGTIAWIFSLPVVYPALVLPSFKYDMIERLATTSTHAFGLGVVTMMAVTVLGYTIFWLIWWAKKH